MFSDCERENAELIAKIDSMQDRFERAKGATMRIMELEGENAALKVKLEKAMKAVSMMKQRLEKAA